MKEKRPVYNGYQEQYLTGAELKVLFPGEYLATGPHHADVLGISIEDYLCAIKIDDAKTYRIFINHAFCKVMKGDTDGEVAFFGHTPLEKTKLYKNLEDIHLEKQCPECGNLMEFKEGRYGAFMGCTGYPDCRHTMRVPYIGKFAGPPSAMTVPQK